MTPSDLSAYEKTGLNLLTALNFALAARLKEKHGKAPEIVEVYLFNTANHIQRSTSAYILLREAEHNYASKNTVRTAIEAMFRMLAVFHEPKIYQKISIEEQSADKKYLKARVSNGGTDYTAGLAAQAANTKKTFRARFPTETLSDAPSNVEELAKIANLGEEYDNHYRYYCRFTHPTIRGMAGEFDNLDYLDNWMIATAVYRALVVMNVQAPGPINPASFEPALDALGDEMRRIATANAAKASP